MPKIAELKEIDGAVWARVEIDLSSSDQPIHLMVESEVETIRKTFRRLGVEDVELAIMRQYEDAVKAADHGRLARLGTALHVVREQFPGVFGSDR